MGYEKMSFDIFAFDAEDGLDALKVLEEAAELQVAFKEWGGPIVDKTYDTDHFDEKTELREATEDELADVVISCVNLAKLNGLDLGAGIARKNLANSLRQHMKELQRKANKSYC